MKLETIVVALDNSELAESVVAALDRLELEENAKLIFAHVLPTPTSERDLDPERPHKSSLYPESERQLEAIAAQFSQPREIEIVTGNPSEEIVRLAHIYQADLILIGTRGLKGVKRIIEGSVSSDVVADAPCSVWVVKS